MIGTVTAEDCQRTLGSRVCRSKGFLIPWSLIWAGVTAVIESAACCKFSVFFWAVTTISPSWAIGAGAVWAAAALESAPAAVAASNAARKVAGVVIMILPRGSAPAGPAAAFVGRDRDAAGALASAAKASRLFHIGMILQAFEKAVLSVRRQTRSREAGIDRARDRLVDRLDAGRRSRTNPQEMNRIDGHGSRTGL